MPDHNFITYLRTLELQDWNKKATEKWTVKDVVAHMVAWEKSDIEVIPKIWNDKHKTEEWGSGNFDDDFNAQAVDYYKKYTPEQLLVDWQLYQKQVQDVMKKIGIDQLKTRMDLFDWLFEGIEDNRSDGTASHYKHHYYQIKQAVSK